MPLQQIAGRVSLIDVLDRVLDKGIAFDPWTRVTLVPLQLIGDGHEAVATVRILLGHETWPPPDPDTPAAACGVIPPNAGPSGAAPLAAPLTVHAARRSRALPASFRRPID